MSARWIRFDTTMPTHDKIMRLTTAGQYRAAFAYTCALAWSGGNATDGHIPTYALTAIHARKVDADSLVSAGLFDPDGDGWQIRNWAKRQPPSDQLMSGSKGACVRWHGANCGCWRESK